MVRHISMNLLKILHQKAHVRVFLHQSVQERQLGLLQRQEKALDKPWQKLDLVVPRFSLVPICRYGNVLRRSSELEQCSQEDACLSSLRSGGGLRRPCCNLGCWRGSGGYRTGRV